MDEHEAWLLASKVESLVKEQWGDRCDSFCPGCCLCLAWESFDYLFGKDEESNKAMDRLRDWGKEE